MKRILFLLLLTVSVYGQNPSRFAKIQITGNANSATATKVNVQEANGEVNTQTINTGFNKNIGLGGSDVVGANTLLNQYATTPVDWTATAFNSGQVVFYGGKQWIAKMATVAGDVPSVSSKWEEITFEALSNKTTTVDQTIIDGSTNSVSGNAVFDGLALKSNIGHTHVASQITDLSKASVGLGNVDNTSDLSKPLSTATINALATKFPTPTGLTTNYLPKWNGSGFGNSQIFDNGTNVGIGTNALITKFQVSLGNDKNIGFYEDGEAGISSFTDGGISNAPLAFNATEYIFKIRGVAKAKILNNGNLLINKTDDDLTNKLQVAGTISASPATTANQVPTWGQVQAIARPYKVYTALLSQTGTNAPTIIVLENTLGATISMTRQSTGHYRTTISTGNFPANRTFKFIQNGNYTITKQQILTAAVQVNTVAFDMYTEVDGVKADDVLMNAAYEIRIYP